jgi:hypothetical protein
MSFLSRLRLTLIFCVSVLILASCSVDYDRENFSFSEFMKNNGEDIAEYLQDNWDIDSAFIMHMGFFQAKDWKSIYPEEMQTIFVGNDRYSESEYLEEKGFDVNAPLFIVYFSKLSKVKGNSYDDAGVNAGSLMTEYSETGLDAAHENYKSGDYNYEDRLYYMSYATIVDGQFRLLMCCDVENYNDEIAFSNYYNLIGRSESFYPFTIGGLVKEWKHKKDEGNVYENARSDFKKFCSKQKIAVFSPLKKRKNKDSDFEIRYNGFQSGSLKSLDYFYMIYNGAFIYAALEEKKNKERDEIKIEIRKILDLMVKYCGDYNNKFDEPEGAEIREKLGNDSLNENELMVLLKRSRELEKPYLIADRLAKKIESIVDETDLRETYKLDALRDLEQCLNRGYTLNDIHNCKEESFEEYVNRMIDLETNFDEKMKQRFKYHR